MPDGGTLMIQTGNVTVDEPRTTAHAIVEPGEYASIRVSDSGVGMSPEVVSRAFEPFFTTKPLGQGTGLGLSMLYGFARQSGGYVEIDSALGQGTRVRVALPRHRSADPPTEVSAEAKSLPRADRGRTVLVVEDEALVRMLAVEVVQSIGHVAVEACDGQAAMRLLRERPPVDLLLTDVGLPGMNGRQLADVARERQPGLKVLFMTGYAHDAAIGSGMLEPGMALLGKPFTVSALADKLHAMLEDAPATVAAPLAG